MEFNRKRKVRNKSTVFFLNEDFTTSTEYSGYQSLKLKNEKF